MTEFERTGSPAGTARLRAHLQIARPDHWIKNAFVLPGVVAALALAPGSPPSGLAFRLLAGLVATCLVASANYTLNELVDAQRDLHHPTKRHRPVVTGAVHVPAAYGQWLVLWGLGTGLGIAVSLPFAGVMAVFGAMGVVYNVPPLRTKEVPYLDVLSEAVNNPLRLLAGWWIVETQWLGPASLLLSYWLVGAYFMALKRFAELRSFPDRAAAAKYRSSFSTYDETRLLTFSLFLAAAGMLFLGAFIMRYRLELVLSFPFLAWVMAIYFQAAFEEESPVQAPERLLCHRRLMVAVALCSVVMLTLLWANLPWLYELFAPTLPPAPQQPVQIPTLSSSLGL